MDSSMIVLKTIARLLMMQYSVEQGQNKSELDYRKVRGTLVIVLMNEGPELFDCMLYRLCKYKKTNRGR